MKIPNQQLSAALALVNQYSGRSTMPILTCARFQNQPEGLTIETTDLDSRVKVTFRNYEGKTAPFAIPIHHLIKALPLMDSEIDMQWQYCKDDETGKVQFASQRTALIIESQGADEFPLELKVRDPQMVVARLGDFRACLERVSRTAGTDESRFVLCSILLEVGERQAKLVSCNGFQLSVQNILSADGPETKSGIIIPSQTVKILTNLLAGPTPDPDSAIGIEWNDQDSIVRFQFDVRDIAVELQSKLIQGNYPNYTQVIPTEHGPTAAVETAELLAALRFASLGTGPSKESTTITLKNSVIDLASEHDGIKCDTTIKCKGDGEAMVTMDPCRLIAIVEQAGTDRLVLKFGRIGRFEPLQVVTEQGDWLSLCMPMKAQ